MVNIKLNNVFLKLTVVLFTVGIYTSCKILKAPKKLPEYAVDIVCGMKVDKAEAYDWKYNGTKYYFDTYSCKEIFKMNPEKFIENKCIEIK